MPVTDRFHAAVTTLLSRNSRRLAVQATALSVVMPLAGGGAAAASVARSAHLAPRESQAAPEVSLARAPAALQVAARKAVGSAALAGGPVQQAKLTASDGMPGEALGISVAISGSTAIVGASGRNSDTGAAYGFVRTGTAWSQRAELTPAGATTRDYFGGSVAISGATVVVGADFSNVGSKVNAGAAYVFIRGSWVQRAKLTASDGGRADVFGTSVAVTKATVASGPEVVAGAPGNKLNTGAAYVYVLPS